MTHELMIRQAILSKLYANGPTSLFVALQRFGPHHGQTHQLHEENDIKGFVHGTRDVGFASSVGFAGSCENFMLDQVFAFMISFTSFCFC